MSLVLAKHLVNLFVPEIYLNYDVTRLYDASDWLEVLYLWGKEKTFVRPQISCVYLIPHRRLDFTDPAVIPPAQTVWQQIHADQLEWHEP